MEREKTIIRNLYDTCHRSKKDLYQISEEMGIGYTYLSRAVLDSPSGVNFPLKWLIPLMKATKNYSVLHRIANLCGFLLVRLPRGAAKFKKMDRQVNDYQKEFTTVISSLFEFINNPTEEKLKTVNENLLDHMRETEYWRKRCEKNLTNQSEMFDEDANEK